MGQPTRQPASNGRKGRKRVTFWGVVKTFFQVLFLVLFVGSLVGMVVVWQFMAHAPKTIDLTFNPPGVTQIYSADDVLLAKYFVENRQEVSIDQIPKDLQNATIAFEDRRFWTRKWAIDWQGIGRAIVSNAKRGDLTGEGASTITQQLARNLGVDGLTREKSVSRKLKEWLVANQIEHSYSRQRILQMYLNEVNYGSGAYGVQAAAKTYFGKDVKDLDLAECALLAGLPNRPTFFNPYRDKDEALKQRAVVLGWMLEEHYITPDQYQAAKDEPIKLASPHQPKLGSTIIRAPYFVSYVYDQLREHYGDQYLKDGNIKVYTTLNYGMQIVAEQVVAQHLADQPRDGPNDACLIAMDPKTGEIKAMVGGRDYKASQFNIATQGRRQPGSLFKAILYSAAIDSGMVTEDTTALDARVSYPMGDGKWWTPKDDDGWSDRAVSLKTAMAMSINVPAVKTMKLIGPDRVIQYARLMGVNSPLDPVLSLALGSSAVTPLEMVDVYATFPAGGYHVEPITFTRVEDFDGKVLDDMVPSPPTLVLSKNTVTQLDDMLRSVVTDGTACRTPVADIPDAAGKTGTTQDHKDTWFIGFTPRLVCGVWMGHPTHDPRTGKYAYGDAMGGDAWGATTSAPIWADFMKLAEPIFVADEAKEASRYKKPAAADTTDQTASTDASKETGADVKSKKPREALIIHNKDGTVTANIDNDTGLLAPAGAPNSSPVTFQAGTEPTTMAPQYAGRSSDTDNTNSSPSSQAGGAQTDDQPGTQTGSGSDSPVQSSTGSPGASAPSSTGSGSSPVGQAQPGASSESGQQDDSGDNAPDTSTSPVPPQPQNNGSTSVPPPSVSESPAPEVEQPPVAPPVHHKKPTELVTVYINPDDGLLANQWTPEKVPKTFIKGTEPRRVTKMYGPPPGEH